MILDLIKVKPFLSGQVVARGARDPDNSRLHVFGFAWGAELCAGSGTGALSVLTPLLLRAPLGEHRAARRSVRQECNLSLIAAHVYIKQM